MIFTRVEPQRRLAIHTVEAELTMDGVLRAMRALFADPDFESGFGVVWDLRGNELAITLREILYLDPRIVELANDNRPRGKVAWAPPPGLARPS